MRIKIFSQEGVSWGNIEIPYHTDGSFTSLKASTFNLQNGKVVEQRLENKDIFNETINKSNKLRKAAMPGVVPGSVIDIEYELSEPASISLRPFYLQYRIPVDFVDYQVELPEYFRFHKAVKGIPIKMTQRVESKNGILGTGSAGSNVTYGINVEIYSASNVGSLRDEPFVLNMNNYRAHVVHDLASIQMPSGKIYNYSSTWDDIAVELMKAESFGEPIRQRLSELNPVVDEAMKLDEAERMNYLYYYVRDNFAWNESSGEQTQEGLRKLLSNNTGNIGDINLLLINLLTKAQLDVVPVIMNSRRRGMLNFTHPSLAQIDYVVAMVRLGEKEVFLDATEKGLIAGFLPPRALNMDGIVIGKNNKTVRIQIPNPNTGSYSVQAILNLNPDMTIAGKVRQIHENFSAVSFRSRYITAERKEGYLKWLMDKYPDMEVSHIEFSGLEGNEPKIVETMDVAFDNMANSAEPYIYLNPMLIWQETENPLKSEKREFPVFFDSRTARKLTITITLPEGVEVESLPKPQRLSMPDNMGSFVYNVAATGNKLNIQFQSNLSAELIPPQHYDTLRNFLTLIVDKHAERIVLKKI
ncbi:MAG: DUF3857 domain-containing protein [Bacteroidetes bacterium]|nr:DUF3857 domain-containing protein [Bacteroidota bacterium]